MPGRPLWSWTGPKTPPWSMVTMRIRNTSGGPAYLEWIGPELAGRMAALIPPARKSGGISAGGSGGRASP